MGLHVKGTVAHGTVASTQGDRGPYEGGWAKPTSPDTTGGPLTSRGDHANGLYARGPGVDLDDVGVAGKARPPNLAHELGQPRSRRGGRDRLAR